MTQPSNRARLEMVPVQDLDEAQQFALLAIRNQQIVRENSYSSHLIGEDEHADWIERQRNEDTLQFYAVRLEGRIVGGVGLRKIDNLKGAADWSFYVSGVEHGHGIGLALGICALDMFFGKLALRCVTGEALAINAASQNYHLKLGFREVGRAHHLVQPGNEMAEIVVYSLSEKEWAAQRGMLLDGV